jgi:hypothetical protein
MVMKEDQMLLLIAEMQRCRICRKNKNFHRPSKCSRKISPTIKFNEKTKYSCLRCLFKKEQLHLLDIMLINFKKEGNNIFQKISPDVNKFSKIFPDRPVAHTSRFCTSDSYILFPIQKSRTLTMISFILPLFLNI